MYFLFFNNIKKHIFHFLFRGQTDSFLFKSKSVGKLTAIVLSHIEREVVPMRNREGRDASWHCHEVIVKDLNTDTTYIFPVDAWLDLYDQPQEFILGEKSETAIAKTRTLENIQYEVAVVTADEKGAGTGKIKHRMPLIN